MAVKIRLLRMGRKKKPFFRIVAIDTKSRRDGRYLDKVGYYDPLTRPATVKIDKEKILEWLKKGAVPSDTVFNLLQKEGITLEWHLIRNNVNDQARNIEIQKWELSRKKSTEVVEIPEKPKKISAPKGKAAKPSEEEVSPDKEAVAEAPEVIEEKSAEVQVEISEEENITRSESPKETPEDSNSEVTEKKTEENQPETSAKKKKKSQSKD